MGFSVKNIVICIIGILIAIIIRGLLLLNEENVPVPIVEWLVVIAAALVGRYFMYGVIL
jgi:surface polysaccharide O-acyltransferase-like enzyme